MSLPKPCEHLLNPPDLSIDLVLDAQIQPANALVGCRAFGQGYLVELVDIHNDTCAYRLSLVDIEVYAQTLRSVNQGSCDLQRAQNELTSLANQATRLSCVLIRQGGVFTRLIDTDETLPTLDWRQLPCDGTLLAGLGLG